MVLLTELDTNLIDQTEVRQVLEFAVAVNPIADEAALVDIYFLLRGKLLDLM